MRIGKISALYDIENNLIINYNFDKNFNERNYYKRQLKFLIKGDIILADRGYYSEELLEMTDKLGVKCVFRLRKDLKVVKIIDSKRKRIVANVRNTKLHVISYNIEIEKKLIGEKLYKTYYIGTTLSKKIWDRTDKGNLQKMGSRNKHKIFDWFRDSLCEASAMHICNLFYFQNFHRRCS
jgi:Transposase DDE domain.